MVDAIMINTVEMHTGGEPLRIVQSGYPHIEGDTILEKRKYVKENLDYIRKCLMYEPRGHYDMYGAIRVEPDLPDADVAFLFMHNEGYSTMCGHAVVALGRYCVDNKFVKYKEPETQVNIQCPCGLVRTYVKCVDGKTSDVRFESVPAFVYKLDVNIAVPKYGDLTVDVVYGGAFYAFISFEKVGLNEKSPVEVMKSAATSIADAVKSKEVIVHPNDESLGFLYGVIFTSESLEPAYHVTIFADAQVDRSPCGSGSTARMALLHHRHLVGKNEEVEMMNPFTRSKFKAKLIKEAQCGKYDAVIVEICGNGYYTGKSTFITEADDSLREGFLIA